MKRTNDGCVYACTRKLIVASSLGESSMVLAPYCVMQLTRGRQYVIELRPKMRKPLLLMRASCCCSCQPRSPLALLPAPHPRTPQRLFLVLDNTLRAYNLMRDGAAKNLNTPEAAMLPRKVGPRGEQPGG
jgi:hypothetical protein